MADNIVLLQELIDLWVKGGRIGGWEIQPATKEDLALGVPTPEEFLDNHRGGLKAGGMGFIFHGVKLNMRGQKESGAVKIQLPATLPDGTRLYQSKADQKRQEFSELKIVQFEHENSVLEYLQSRLQIPNVLKSLDKGAHQHQIVRDENVDTVVRSAKVIFEYEALLGGLTQAWKLGSTALYEIEFRR